MGSIAAAFRRRVRTAGAREEGNVGTNASDRAVGARVRRRGGIGEHGCIQGSEGAMKAHNFALKNSKLGKHI